MIYPTCKIIRRRSIWIKLSYKEQLSPDDGSGLYYCEDFIGNDKLGAMVLGDNIFHVNGFASMLKEAVENTEKGKATLRILCS